MSGTDFPIVDAGDCALSVRFQETVSPQAAAQIAAFIQSYSEKPARGLVELVPSFGAVLVIFDPMRVSRRAIRSDIRHRTRALSAQSTSSARLYHIPVCYGGAMGEDISTVAEHAGLSCDEVIALHSGAAYRIYMLGFLPGFAYLGGLDARIHTPRLKTPRTLIPARSVGIGGEQTGIYPIDSPGGWQLIGRTPVRPYDLARDPAILYRAGDFIRFEPVDMRSYEAIEADVLAGRYTVETETVTLEKEGMQL